MIQISRKCSGHSFPHNLSIVPNSFRSPPLPVRGVHDFLSPKAVSSPFCCTHSDFSPLPLWCGRGRLFSCNNRHHCLSSFFAADITRIFPLHPQVDELSGSVRSLQQISIEFSSDRAALPPYPCSVASFSLTACGAGGGERAVSP